MYKYTIKYYYGTYKGTRTVWADDEEEAVGKMWRGLKQYMTLPMACQSHEVISVESGD